MRAPLTSGPSCFNPLCQSKVRRSDRWICRCGVRYCSADCQKEHWGRGHAEQCETLEDGQQFTKLARIFIEAAHENEWTSKWIWKRAAKARKQHGTDFILRLDFESPGNIAVVLQKIAEEHQDPFASITTSIKAFDGTWERSKQFGMAYDMVCEAKLNEWILTVIMITVPTVEGSTQRHSLIGWVLSPEHTKLRRRQLQGESVSSAELINTEGQLPASEHVEEIDEHIEQLGRIAAREILMDAAKQDNVDLLELGKRCANEYGRGGFMVRFASVEAVKERQAATLDDYATSVVATSLGNCGFKYSKRVSCRDSLKVWKKCRELVEPCKMGTLGNCVSFYPADFLMNQLKSSTTSHLNTYDVNTAICLVCQISLSDAGDVHTMQQALVFDCPKSTGRKAWTKEVRKVAEKEKRLPGTDNIISFSDLLADPDCKKYHGVEKLSPLAKEVEDFLIPVAVARSYICSEQFEELMISINEFLCREVSSIEEQERYRFFIAQGDARALLAAGMVQDNAVMPKLFSLWKCAGGAPAFSAEAKERRQCMARRIDSAIEAGVLSVCAACSDTSMSRKLKCSGCKEVWYCNSECQNDHWKVHKQVCKAGRSKRSN
eukprot:gnl/MRDRNA2_/MRDRNA2_137836_c0_seq1.p1 gnl/MRDRNA2_/MRDRNA2_137836_c0~~gnl/MRDRNA2_/MRDRNA2_137836_c0_seq1.p1  ORF type:complete len:605 (+),score=106.00 gnl/MRDRNA2_/MRDRNA2_137836_c0_seq1:100-1914(+)